MGATTGGEEVIKDRSRIERQKENESLKTKLSFSLHWLAGGEVPSDVCFYSLSSHVPFVPRYWQNISFAYFWSDLYFMLKRRRNKEHKKSNWTNKTPRPDRPVERVFQMRLMICDWVSGFLEIPASFQLPSSIRRCILGRERDRPPWLCQWKKKGGGKLSLREIKRYSKCFDDPHSHSTKSFESR